MILINSSFVSIVNEEALKIWESNSIEDYSSRSLISRDKVVPEVEEDQIELIGDIGYVRRVLSPHLCKSIILQSQQKSTWEKSITVGELNNPDSAKSSPRQSSSIHISGNPELRQIDSLIHRTFSSALVIYSKKINNENEDTKHLEQYRLGVSRDEGYSLLKYEKGGYYRVHTDQGSNNGANQPLIRVLSGLIYLNDNYEGGEIYFPRQDVKIKPEQGSVVWFPSIYTHPHTSLDVIEGTKYSIVSWWI